MTHLFKGQTADDVWRQAIKAISHNTNVQTQPSRLGPTREILHSTLAITNSKERWVFSRLPAINPAFAIAEVVWIIQGRRDAEFLNFWNPLLPQFAGEDKNYHGAYGHRLRVHLGFDQLERAFDVLSNNPESRQVVLQIWDSRLDFPTINGTPASSDVPCNICAMPKIRNGKLEWLQVMRSNDLFLGTPHNFVQFTSLQEILAGWLEVEMGEFVQIADSMHCYQHDLEKYTVSECQQPTKNTDSLALSKTESSDVLSRLEYMMDIFRSSNCTSKILLKCIEDAELPTSYQNLLLIVAADSARRFGWMEEMKALSNQCTNPALNIAWENWKRRTVSTANT